MSKQREIGGSCSNSSPHGIPASVSQPGIHDHLALERDKTISDFGDQWTRHQKNTGRYASLEQFEDIVAPFLSRTDFQHQRCADIGSGTGRIVRMLIDAGAEHVTAIEPSRAYDVLVLNTADVSDRVTCLNLRGDELPPKDYGVVVSIGVIHHIPDPKPVLEAAFRGLKPDGTLLIWVYGHEGSQLYRSIFLPVRMITRRLPVLINEAIAAIIYPVTVAYGRLTALIPFLPLRRYMQEVYLRFDPPVRRLVILDQINPQWAKYYDREEIETLVRSVGFVDVRLHHRHGYSWTVIGRKPE
ncbi:class I SAM-dependent methyltransferase [Bradyrhizobium tropiciagri]|uniref:class I SAM-dependent methyltransferase n=1 Tax=Bradyrhizobium tropiciagri TaxID=312253 RepID=UPI0020116176|nr:class I SAM-dependent methyltransferase [Bradyrhizobium tropiciagri]